MNEKKGFLLYFDSRPMLMDLSAEQRGWLMGVLFDYAECVCKDETTSIEEVMDACPELSQSARMACRFMAANILRDTRRWLGQQQSRIQRRQNQSQGQGRGRGQDAAAVSEEARRYQENMERIRRLMAQDDEAEKSGYQTPFVVH